jgi:iron complex outermembrane recepter protein
MLPRFPLAPRRIALAAACACLTSQLTPAFAQTATKPATESLDKVVVTGNPLRGTLTLPADALEGDALVLQRTSNLGDTLAGMPGVAASNFGPNASRPVIRGLDGDRVRILSNAGATVDASNLSFDHAVALDPLVVDRIEVLRGPAALLYGGNALGGVVNLLDNRIPKTLTPGVTGAAELRLGGATRERNAAVVLDGGSGRSNTGWGWHADVSSRDALDQRSPSFESDGEWRKSVRNSQGDGRAGALGGSVFFGSGYAGVSVDDLRNNYGVTAEPDVSIRMQRQRVATAGEWSGQGGPITRLSWQASRNRYQHQELEGDGAVGTTFKSRGSDGRLEATHATLALGQAKLTGVFGAQWEQLDFSALGDEAFVPSTHTRQTGIFLLEQLSLGAAQITAGLRQDRVTVRSEGDAPDAEEPKFGPAHERSFKPRSLALGATLPLGQGWHMSGNLSRSERAPAYYELYANGIHVATAAAERGDTSLGLERARGLDLGLKWEGQASHLHFNVYETRFDRYIALAATGEEVDDEGELFPVYAFEGVPARLRGLELEGRFALPTAAWAPGLKLALLSQLDAVRGERTDTGEPLPRLAPLRAMLGLEAQWGAWAGRVELRGAARQTRVPVLDTPTAGSGMWRLALTRQWRADRFDVLAYLKLDNLGNQLAYNATAVATIRGLAPQPGRAASVGVQVRF